MYNVLYSFARITFLIMLCITWDVSIFPSKGRIQFRKLGIRSGFLIVVENDKGFALLIVMICYVNLL